MTLEEIRTLLVKKKTKALVTHGNNIFTVIYVGDQRATLARSDGSQFTVGSRHLKEINEFKR